MSPLESELQGALLLAAPKLLPNLRLFRRNVAAAKIDGRVTRFGIAGQSDLYGLVRGGQHIELELKTPTGVMSDRQHAWQAWCIEWGVPHLVLKAKKGESIEATVARWIEEIRSALAQSTSKS